MTEKSPSSSAVKKFLLHLLPIRVDRRTIEFTRTFGLGIVTMILFLVLLITGMILRFSYIPTPTDAYDSILHLEGDALFGKMIRNLHHISGKLMMVFSFLHLVRVFYSQAIYGVRAKNWIYGLLLLFMVMLSSFTGYLLPWDQLAYWAVTIVTQIFEYIPHVGIHLANFVRGGDVVNGNTLLNFYNLHTGIVPIVFLFLLSMHFWLIRKAGGVALPKQEEKRVMIDAEGAVAPRITMICLIVLALLFIASVLFQAPLLEQANPNVSPNPSKAPWYFLGAQELLLHLHPAFGALLIPLLVMGFFIALPYFRFNHVKPGTWFYSETGKKLTMISAIFSALFTFVLILALEYLIDFASMLPSFPVWISTGIFPFLLYSIPLGGFLLYWKKIKNAEWIEITIGLVTILLTSYIVMMFIGIFLRGEGMKLIF